jgi:MYXO-CTERM domain-containing protein
MLTRTTRTFFTAATAALMLIAIAGPADAAVVQLTVVNGDFETDTATAAGATGWTTSNFWTVDGSGDEDINSPQAGTNFLSADRRAPNPDASQFLQSTASQSIDLSAHAAGIDLGTATVDIDFFVAHQDGFDDPSATLQFFDGSNIALGSLINTGDVGQDDNSGNWLAATIGGGAVAVPVNARSMTLTLIATKGTGGSVIQTGFDSVSASITVVPEPASLAMGLMGLTLLAGRRRR